MPIPDFCCCSRPQTVPLSDTPADDRRPADATAKSPLFITLFFQHLWAEKAKLLVGVGCIAAAVLLFPYIGTGSILATLGGLICMGLCMFGGNLIGAAIGRSVWFAWGMTIVI